MLVAEASVVVVDGVNVELLVGVGVKEPVVSELEAESDGAGELVRLVAAESEEDEDMEESEGGRSGDSGR